MRELEQTGDAAAAVWPATLPAGADAAISDAAGANSGAGAWANAFSTRRLLVFVLLTVVFTMTAGQITDPDFWWHLRTGQLIYETHAIPHTDIFSFTAQGKEWVTHEWLAEVLIYVVYKWTSWGGLVIAFSLVMTAALWIAYRRAARYAPHPYVAGAVMLTGALATAPMWGVRPQMISFLFTSIYVAVLGSYARGGRAKSLVWLVPLMLVWVNMHGGYALGLALVGLTGAGIMLDEFVRGEGERLWSERLRLSLKRLWPLLLLFAACVLVVPLNPNGLRMFSYPFETLNSHAMHAYIDEWFTPNFHLVISQPFALLVFATFAALALSPKRARPSELLLLCVAAYAALRAWRNIPLFALVAIPLLAEHSWQLLTSRGQPGWLAVAERRETGKKAWVQLAFNVVLLVCVPVALCVANVAKVSGRQASVEAEKYPAAAMEFLRAHGDRGALYNEYGWGGYLIWKLYPSRLVYIDGRADVYGDAFMEEALGAMAGERDWRAALERYDVRTVMIKPSAPLASLLRQDASWRSVYEDGQAVVFFKQ
ncbi:MAG TPA: hypothetical protein VGW12_17050 [Pyrinomonadaceae bacterium]|nr:hypothetical protein [Pyrinomonadaceae bacterium]